MPVKSRIRTIPHYPRHGIQFRDITTLLKDPIGFRIAIDELHARYAGQRIDKVVGIESRGFIVGAPLAYKLGVGFVPAPPSTLYWVGSNGTSWTAADNWSASTIASSGNATLALDGSQGVVFASSGANASTTASTVLDHHATITRLTVSSAQPVSIGGSGTLTINGSSETAISIESNAGNVTIGVPIVFSGNSGTISVKRANPLLSIASLGGSNGLQKSGNGTLQLTGASNYTGGTTLSGGTLRLLHSNALGSGELYLSSGTLAVGSIGSRDSSGTSGDSYRGSPSASRAYQTGIGTPKKRWREMSQSPLRPATQFL